MSCNRCTALKPISKCTDEIVIGTATADTDYFVYFQNVATGRINKYEATSNGDGLISIESPFEFSVNTTYKVWVNTQANTIFNEVSITIGETTDNCFEVSFTKVYNGNNFETFETQTFEING